MQSAIKGRASPPYMHSRVANTSILIDSPVSLSIFGIKGEIGVNRPGRVRA